MKALVIYESFFGNTEKVAQAIAGAMRAAGEVEVRAVGDVKPEHLKGIDVLVVGAATRAFSPSPATKAWLKALPAHALDGVQVAGFDTRIPIRQETPRFLALLIKVFGNAAEPIAARLVKRGGRQIVAPAGFGVKDSEGPLFEGELERAAAWGGQIAAAVAQP